MHVMSKYLDTHKAAIKALLDYPLMEATAQDTTLAHHLREGMTSIGSPAMDGMPTAHDPRRGESRIAATLDKLNMLEQRKQEAAEYLSWFGNGWSLLTEEDRFVLENFFLGDGSQDERVRFLSDHFHIERDSVYRKKNRAVERLAISLYWR